MTDTITPTAIDAFVLIEAIRVVGRHRKDLRDLRPLAASIEDVGLLHPVVLSPDGSLLAGQRRLEACRLLGWDTVPVRIAHSADDAAKLLRAERDENVCREAMLPSELASLGAEIEAIESERAKARQLGSLKQFRSGASAGTEEGRETREVVGEALGMSARTYSDLRAAHSLANDESAPEPERAVARGALAEMDRTGSIKPAADKMRQRLRAKRDAQEAKAAAIAPDPEPTATPEPESEDWIPGKGDSSPRAVARRRHLIRSLAARGWSSRQIGQHIDILDQTVRRIAREEGIALPADEALGARTRQKIDSNRIVRETVSMLEGLDMGLDLIRFEDLDLAEIENWTASLSESIRVLNRLNKRLKGMVQ